MIDKVKSYLLILKSPMVSEPKILTFFLKKIFFLTITVLQKNTILNRRHQGIQKKHLFFIRNTFKKKISFLVILSIEILKCSN